MFSKLGILFLASIVCRTYSLPPCVCARNYLPVCGSDDETYANQCLFDCARNSNHDLTVAHQGQCGQATPICICTMEYKPVCGSDGETYPNKCALECQTARYPEVQLKHEGQCNSETIKVAELPCTCTRQMEPVCGSDGVTYDNPCKLECRANQTSSGLTKQHDGPCEQVKVAEVKVVEDAVAPVCTCTRNMKPVCGTDGVTYNNLCLLECAAQNKPLEKKSDGSCDESNTVKVAEVKIPSSCICTRNLKPVCGTDGVTYNNPCLLECAALNKPVEKKSDGICDGSNTVKVVEQAPTTCTCTREEMPVCGSDGQTYANHCLLECAAKSNPSLTLVHADPCEETAKVDNATKNSE